MKKLRGGVWKKKNHRKKKTNLNKKKRKREGERKSQRNQKSDNGARGKSFRFTGAPRRNPVGGGGEGRQKQKRKKAYEEGRLGGEDRGRSGKEGLKLLADISSGEQAR